jgi:pimeloyl-ACP methyl ester carboxylesterase
MNAPENLSFERGTVASSDGTLLGYLRFGDGPPLVVCHGSFSTAEEWLRFGTELASTRTVYLYDRRGRGQSPDIVSETAIDAEVDDLAAIVGLAGADAAVMGHSFGGGCALSFAARGGFASPLVLYEPRHSLRGPMGRGRIAGLDQLIDAGDREAAVQYAMEQIIGLPPQAVARMRATPLWVGMVRTVHAFPRELRLLDTLAWTSGDLDGVVGPSFLLVGENSPVLPDALSPDVALRTLLPAMRIMSVPGQGHFAYAAAPALLADLVKGCLSA